MGPEIDTWPVDRRRPSRRAGRTDAQLVERYVTARMDRLTTARLESWLSYYVRGQSLRAGAASLGLTLDAHRVRVRRLRRAAKAYAARARR